MKRILRVALVAVAGLAATNAYGQGGCMHGGGGGRGGGSMGMGGMSSMVQQAYMQNQYAQQQQFARQMYMQQLYEQQQNAARQQERAERRANKIAMLKERRASELAKKSGAKGSAGSTAAANNPNLSEMILAKRK